MLRGEEVGLTGEESRPSLRGPIPGKRAKLVLDADREFVATTTKTSPIAARAGRGAVILTEDGDVLLDFTSGIGVVNTGHCHPTVVKAIQEQADRLIHFAGTDFYYSLQSDLAKELAGIVPGAFPKKTFFANSGTEANEAALKVVRWSTQRPQLLAFTRGFHGRTMGSLSLTSSKLTQRERFFPTMPGVHQVPFPNPYRNPFGIDGYADPDALTSAVLNWIEEVLETQLPPSEAGAFFVEPVQGEGGYIFPPDDFFRQLKKLLDGHGILLVADEIQTGFGRTGTMFAMEQYGVAPPITTMAKGMASGLPMGACVFDAKLDFGVSGAHSNTFGGNLVACAAARATLRVFREEKLLERTKERGKLLGRLLQEMQRAAPSIGDVRGRGLMWALDFVKDAKTKAPNRELRDRVVKEAYLRGLILLPSGSSAIRVIPPLVVTTEQVESAGAILGEAVRAAKP